MDEDEEREGGTRGRGQVMRWQGDGVQSHKTCIVGGGGGGGGDVLCK